MQKVLLFMTLLSLSVQMSSAVNYDRLERTHFSSLSLITATEEELNELHKGQLNSEKGLCHTHKNPADLKKRLSILCLEDAIHIKRTEDDFASEFNDKNSSNDSISLRLINASAALGNEQAKAMLIISILNSEASKKEPIITFTKASDLKWLTFDKQEVETNVIPENKNEDVVKGSPRADSLLYNSNRTKVNLQALLLTDEAKAQLYDLIIDALDYQHQGGDIYETNLANLFKTLKITANSELLKAELYDQKSEDYYLIKQHFSNLVCLRRYIKSLIGKRSTQEKVINFIKKIKPSLLHLSPA